jgi:glycosyltransferase involved in cell wall biosynthesis
MNVLHVAPLWLPVGTDTPGGIETFLAQLCHAQQRQGVSVTLLASGDSDADLPVEAVLPDCVVERMGRHEAAWYEYYEQDLVLRAIELASDFDVVHSHIGATGFAIAARGGSTPVLHTLHNQASDDLCWLLSRHPELDVIAISEAQASVLRSAGARVDAVVHNGLRIGDVPFASVAGDDLVFLGRIEPAKGPDVAIEVARRTGRKLHLAGPVIDGEYFDEYITPSLDDDITYDGVLVGKEKSDLLSKAYCVVMPSTWKEPFGMVAIEAMTAGIPVVAIASGALAEIISDGVSGFVGDDVDELVRGVERVGELDRAEVRRYAGERFDIETVARRYGELYARAKIGSDGG